MVEPGGPHLVLAHLGGDDGITLRQLADSLDFIILIFLIFCIKLVISEMKRFGPKAILTRGRYEEEQ